MQATNNFINGRPSTNGTSSHRHTSFYKNRERQRLNYTDNILQASQLDVTQLPQQPSVIEETSEGAPKNEGNETHHGAPDHTTLTGEFNVVARDN